MLAIKLAMDGTDTQKDPAAETAFRTTLVDKTEEIDIPANTSVRVWVYDEMRYGFIPSPARCGVCAASEP